MSDETTLRDTLESAFDEVATAENTASESSAPVETAEETEARAERARDEAGRFTKAEKAAADKAAKAAEPEAASQAPQRPARPSSWKKDYQAKWDTLVDTDPDMANYLLEREQQFARGVSTYKSEADRAREFNQILEPHAPRFQQYGVEPTQYLGRLLEIDNVLATGTPQQKLALLQSMASAVGVAEYLGGGTAPEGAPQGGYVPPEVMNTLTHLQNRLQSFELQQERAEQTRINREIDAFAENAPYLDDVKDTMAQLLETGMATDLQTAYDKAVRLHDDVFQQYQEQQRLASERDRQHAAKQAAARARSAAVSPRSSTPTGSATASPQGDDIRSALSAAFDAHAGSGRI